MGQAHSQPTKLVHVKHELVKSSVEREVLLHALPVERYRERVIDIKMDFCGCRRCCPDGSVELQETASSLTASFEGRPLKDDEYLRDFSTSAENPVFIRTFLSPPAPIRRHDTHISALPLEILHRQILSILDKKARVAFACTSSHFDAIYKSSPTCDMSRVHCRFNGDEILINAIRMEQSHRVISHVVSKRSDVTMTGKHTALLLALCRNRGPDIVKVLLDPDAGNAIVDTRWMICAHEEICRQLRGNVSQHLWGLRLRNQVRVLAKRRDVLHMLEPFLNAWSSDPLKPDEQDECAICMESHASYTRLNCQHIFGRECIDSWRTTSSTGCPLCRRPF